MSPPLEPRLSDVLDVISVEGHQSESVLEALGRWCERQQWLPIYLVSKAVDLELGILMDCEGRTWVDWGERSRVLHEPPSGARLPFTLWLHTHPRMGAYWSLTDQSTLRFVHSFTERAIVLGQPGFLMATKQGDEVLGRSEDYPDIPWSNNTFVAW